MDMTQFMPHAICLLNNPMLISIFVSSDFAIFVSYMMISSLLFAARRNWQLFGSLVEFMQTGAPDLYQNPRIAQWWFASFATFIGACGFTHLMDIIVLWYPIYWAQAVISMVTALASCSTAYFLIRVITQYVRVTHQRKDAGHE
jgi:hypothetical protein